MAKAITYRQNKKNNSGTLTLKESLTIENLEIIKKSFQDAIAKDGSLILNHAEAEDFDFSYLQLLVSVIKTAESKQKEISFAESDSDKFKNVVNESGFKNLKSFTNYFAWK
jgi:anti-anti-sigma regulatory factor